MTEMPKRRCTGCLERFPLNATYFPHRTEMDRKGEFRSRCLRCKAEAKMRPASPKPTKGDRVHVKGKLPCSECGDLSWRVVGPKCRGCGVLYADKVPLQLRDYLYRTFERVTA